MSRLKYKKYKKCKNCLLIRNSIKGFVRSKRICNHCFNPKILKSNIYNKTRHIYSLKEINNELSTYITNDIINNDKYHIFDDINDYKSRIYDEEYFICNSKKCNRCRKIYFLTEFRTIIGKNYPADKINICIKCENKNQTIRVKKFKSNHGVTPNTDRSRKNPIFKLSLTMRSRLYSFIKYKGIKKNNKTETYIGCTYNILKDYLQNKFKPGMLWENHGEWHIDHIIPLSRAKNEEDLYKLCHYTNLQPLWARDNLSKGKRT